MWLNWQSSWFVISRLSVRVRSSACTIRTAVLQCTSDVYNLIIGWIPEWPKGTDCKSAAICFGGSNPPPSILESAVWHFHKNFIVAGWSSLEARRAHNPKVVGSNPTPATMYPKGTKCPDSSVGRAADWKSACRWFDSGSGHFYYAMVSCLFLRSSGKRTAFWFSADPQCWRIVKQWALSLWRGLFLLLLCYAIIFLSTLMRAW